MSDQLSDSDVPLSPEMEALGIEPAFVDEEGPPIDRVSIRGLLEGRLDAKTAGLIAGRISSYRSWFRACGEEIARGQR